MEEAQETSSKWTKTERTWLIASAKSKCDQLNLEHSVERVPMESGQVGMVPGIEQHLARAISDLAAERSIR